MDEATCKAQLDVKTKVDAVKVQKSAAVYRR